MAGVPAPTSTAASSAVADFLREQGGAGHGEYGTVTGRPRRVGWFDAVAGRYVAQLNGLTGIALTRLDALDKFDTLKICTAYKVNDMHLAHIPADLSILESVEPQYEEHPGWKEDTSGARAWSDLPENARSYIQRICQLIGTPLDMVSVGPHRDQTITLRNTPFTVVGVSHVATGSIVLQTASSYLAIGDAQRLANTTMISQIVAQARDTASVDTAATDVRALLTAAHGIVDFRVETQQQLLDTASQTTNLLTYLLAGIASISLIVGGIGIMNIMLVSVVERTREIGLRKALGATDGDVLTQFLLEAVFLSFGGGLLGVAAGIGLANLLSTISTNLPTEITTSSVSLAFGVATAIGIIFGVLPAVRSARLQPVEALRYE